MRRLLAFVAAVLFALAPMAARAESASNPSLSPVPVQIAAPSGPSIFGMPADQAMTVGIGILTGVIVMDVLVGSGAGILAGALAGAMIGTWWFGNYGPPIRPAAAI